MEYMIYQYEQGKNPVKEINIRTALQWVSRVWYHEVYNQTVVNCFRKSTITGHQDRTSPPTSILILLELSLLHLQLQQQGQISESISLSNFLNPAEE